MELFLSSHNAVSGFRLPVFLEVWKLKRAIWDSLVEFYPLGKGRNEWMGRWNEWKIMAHDDWRDGSSPLPDGEGCLSGWVTVWSLVSKQIRVKTSTRGGQRDEVCGINMLLKRVFARLCPYVLKGKLAVSWLLTGGLAEECLTTLQVSRQRTGVL